MNNHKIAVIIPSTTNVNEDASPETVAKWVRSAKMHFARLFGGFTAHNAVGGWVSQEHGLVEENVTIVTSFTDDDGLEFVETVKEFAAQMAEGGRSRSRSRVGVCFAAGSAGVKIRTRRGNTIPNQNKGEPMSHTIISSHGHLEIDESGNVLSHELSESWDVPIPLSFDVDEFRKTYGQLDSAIDILDIGYTMPDGGYEPPEPDFRARVSLIVP